MTKEKILSLIAKGEGVDVEFKESKGKLNRDIYESVCAMLNRHGGHILLGVTDSGEICGVESAEALIRDFLTAINNPQKLNPPFYLSANIVEIEGKEIIYIFVPESSSVHSVNGKIYDRNGDGDFDITNNSTLVGNLYLRKQSSYSENRIFPYAELSDLRADLLQKVRKRVAKEHPWREMEDFELLKSAGLYKRDILSGKEGLTLGAILLFGKDETIISALPHHRTDAILRQKNLDRYDDRDDIRTNLLESYERLMAFIAKHLSDPFFLEGDRRVSLRDKIFREAIVNLLIHREYSNAYVAKMVIGNDSVTFENANRPHGFGFITPDNFMPYPKNPTIAKVFKEIDYADELGSGVRNLFKYTKIYGGGDPKLIEEDIFKIIVPIDGGLVGKMKGGKVSDQAVWQVSDQVTPQAAEEVTEQAAPQVTEQATEQVTEQAIITFCKTPKSSKEIMHFLKLKHREHFRANILNPLIKKGLLKLTIPDKPSSPKQKYVATKVKNED